MSEDKIPLIGLIIMRVAYIGMIWFAIQDLGFKGLDRLGQMSISILAAAFFFYVAEWLFKKDWRDQQLKKQKQNWGKKYEKENSILFTNTCMAY